MEVKLVARTLDLIDYFAEQARPLSLTEIAQGIDAPVSSCLAMLRTLLAKGYLYEASRRGSYYPTRKLLMAAQRIDAGDPLLELLRPHLVALRDATRETAVLGKLQAGRVIYLDCVESAQVIRYRAEPGETRLAHANSIGKALLSTLAPQALDEALAGTLEHLSDATLLGEALREDLRLSAERGWAANVGESVPDLAALAMPVTVAGQTLAVSIAGPRQRVVANWDTNLAALQQAVATIRQTLAVS